MSRTELKTGWLFPNGDFYPCGTFEHISCAGKIIGDDSYARPDEILHNCGFAEITVSNEGAKEWRVYWKDFLTVAQKIFLKPYFEDDTLPMENAARLRWEQENRI